MTTKKKKSAREKRVLIASLIVAATIMAGSTFAWFTSRDEVTNRLTATASYGVSITEDFAPPSNWLPGQTVNKDVSAINTGNVSAFVKMRLEGAFNIETEFTAGESIPSSPNDISNYELNAHKLALLDNITERQVLQAGNYLAYAPSDVGKGIIPDNFTPTKPGLYLFRRQINIGETTTYDYSGYYYDGSSYYALKTLDVQDSEGNTTRTTDVLQGKGSTLSEDDIKAIKLRAYENLKIKHDDASLTWDYSNVATEQKVYLTYKADPTKDTPSKDIKVEIKLNDLAEDTPTSDQWQYIEADKAFYYTNDLDPGTTSKNLVDSVTLSSTVKDTAFSLMNFDLTVKLDSVQVTTDDSEKELPDSAEDAFGIVPDGNVTYTGNEITTIKWKKTT